ncbi:MAG: DUF4349 domain-containing protein [Candidatus Promineifilaceae bacterium]
MGIKRIMMISLLITGLLMVGCGFAAEPAMDQAASMPAAAPIAAEMEYAVEESAGEIGYRDDAKYNETSIATQDGAQERIIIRTADMSIVVVDTEEAMDSIAQMVTDNDGWVVSSSVYQYAEDAKTGNMSVRIPSDGFESFLNAVSGLAVEVTRVSTSGEDVTEEYVDLSSRLANLEATADRVRNFLDEAKTVEEALQVNSELSRLEGEIEVIKGRMKYLEQSSAYSMISIDLTPDVLSQPLEVGGWQPQGAARSALETLVATLQTLIDAAIWFVIYILPLVLIIAVPVWLVIRYFRRRRAARKAEPVAAAEMVEDHNEGETD